MNVEEYRKIVEAGKNSGEYTGYTEPNVSNKVWTKKKGKMPYFVKLFLVSFLYVIAICILMFVFIAVSAEYSALLITLTFILSLPVFFVVSIKKSKSGFITYVSYEGDLYRLVYTKQNLMIMSGILPAGVIRTAFAVSGVQKAINEAANAGANIEKTMAEMSNDPSTWRIDKIEELKVHKHGFTAKAAVTVVLTNKTKLKKISVQDDYVDYPLLLDAVKKLK